MQVRGEPPERQARREPKVRRVRKAMRRAPWRNWQAPPAVASPAFYATRRIFGTDAGGFTYEPPLGETWTPFTVRGRVPNGAQGIANVTLGFAPGNGLVGGSENWFDAVQLGIGNPSASGGHGSVAVVGESDFVTQTVPILNNFIYEVRAKVRRAVAGGSESPRARIDWISFLGTSAGTAVVEVQNVGADGWTEVVLSDRAPLIAVEARVELLGAAGGSEAFWFDEVSFTNVGL